MKVVVTGPESCGKTTLSAALAAHLGHLLVPEYARDYLTEHGPNYQLSDFEKIVEGQLELLTIPHENVIFDTGSVVLKIWAEEVYHKPFASIEQHLQKDETDLYILTDWRIPYERDPLRENPDDRERLFKKYFAFLCQHHVPMIICRGSQQQRLKSALAAIDLLI